MSTRILSPEGTVGTGAVYLAPSPDVLSGRRLAVLDNGKPGAERLLSRAADRIALRSGALLVGVHRKRTAATPCEDELIERIRQEADLVLTGTAD
jgi:NADPH-dependent 2,4-dienoyl-CoA reductase/sulfur reductase-like enzyme